MHLVETLSPQQRIQVERVDVTEDNCGSEDLAFLATDVVSLSDKVFVRAQEAYIIHYSAIGGRAICFFGRPSHQIS